MLGEPKLEPSELESCEGVTCEPVLVPEVYVDRVSETDDLDTCGPVKLETCDPIL